MGGSEKEMWNGKTKDFTFMILSHGFVDWLQFVGQGMSIDRS